nr:inositol oxygenase 2-like [Ipomoea batatas]
MVSTLMLDHSALKLHFNFYKPQTCSFSLISNSKGLLVEDKPIPFDGNELILDGGFAVPETLSSNNGGFDAPEINAFGQSFRDYEAESERKESVEEFYRVQHINQTYDFVSGKANMVFFFFFFFFLVFFFFFFFLVSLGCRVTREINKGTIII